MSASGGLAKEATNLPLLQQAAFCHAVGSLLPGVLLPSQSWQHD